MPIESFVTTLIHWTFFLMTRTKLASVGFVTAGNPMWPQVLDDAKVCTSLSQVAVRNHMRLFLRTKKYPVLLRTRTCWKLLLQYYSVLQSTTPVLLCNTKYSPVLFCTTKYYSSTTLTKSCTGLGKWRLNFTKCCTPHETWCLNFAKCCTCHEKWRWNL